MYQHYSNPGSSIAYFAHIGGFIGGATLIGIALYFKPKMFNQEYIEEDQSIDPRQEKLAKVYTLIEKYRFHTALQELNKLCEEHGTSFELEKLRYHLMKPDKPKEYENCALGLLKMPHSHERDLELLHEICATMPDYQDKLSDEHKFKLALNLSTPKYCTTAENIFLSLQQNQYHKHSLGILARKLSLTFEKLGNKTKTFDYARIADTQTMGGNR